MERLGFQEIKTINYYSATRFIMKSYDMLKVA